MQTAYKVLILTAIMLALAACNSSKGSGDSNQFKTEQASAKEGPLDYDACALVTKADAEAALGEPVELGKGATTTPMGAKACGYVATALSSRGMVTIYVGNLTLAGNDLWEPQKKLWQGQGKGIQPVDGLGKEAYLAPNGLHILMPKATLHIEVMGLKDEAATINAEKTLAQKAVSRM
ncbi:MAG TPA: hypothetical protein VFA71_06040 [Terriglobales bacterium]|nr:hypothetical protein [Terriglobales bacterium]